MKILKLISGPSQIISCIPAEGTVYHICSPFQGPTKLWKVKGKGKEKELLET
jgi:hypothetical protein